MLHRHMDRLADRDRGILTQEDRKYLRGEKELKQQSERKCRQRIRERLWNAVFDFWHLVEYLDEADWEETFAQSRVDLHREYTDIPIPYSFLHANYRLGGRETDTRLATTAFKEALTDMVAFVCESTAHLSGVSAEAVVEEGMARGLRDYGQTATVSTSDITTELLSRRRAGETVTTAEFRFLLTEYPNLLDEFVEQDRWQQPPLSPREPPAWMRDRQDDPTNTMDSLE